MERWNMLWAKSIEHLRGMKLTITKAMPQFSTISASWHYRIIVNFITSNPTNVTNTTITICRRHETATQLSWYLSCDTVTNRVPCI